MPPYQTRKPGSLPSVDLCEAHVALRAVSGVGLMLAVGTALDPSSIDMARWWESFALGCGLALPAVLSWLVVGCLTFRRLADRGDRGTWRLLSAATLGAVSALWPWLGWHGLQGTELPPLRAVAIALTGALVAMAFTMGLRYRLLLTRPAQATTRLAVLQSRIRPHFLFNTLNTAIALVRIDPLRAESVLEDLSDLFRAALAQGDGPLESTLRDEVELGRRYLAIEQLRFGDRMQVEWDLDPDLMTARLPALFLQPLLENAVRHGVEPAEGKAWIRITLRREVGQAQMEVSNSLTSSVTVPGHGMALENLKERLILMHGLAGNFRAASQGDRFVVAVQVPA